jgi:dipeptidyl-peptidase-4
MDDNVHMQNIIQLISKMQDLNQDFELMIYPGGRHGWGGPKRVHSTRKTVEFWFHHLLDKPVVK